jgi:Spy/CpxP family protein refolding chaperone
MKPKLLITIIIILVVLNVITLGIIWMKRPPMPFPGGDKPPGDRGPIAFLKNELKLSDDQYNKFNQAKDRYRETAKKLNDSIFVLEKLVEKEIFNEQYDSLKVKTLSESIAGIQKEFEVARLKHFRELAGICTPEQKKHFESVFHEAFGEMPPPPSDERRQGPPGRDGHHMPPPPGR